MADTVSQLRRRCLGHILYYSDDPQPYIFIMTFSGYYWVVARAEDRVLGGDRTHFYEGRYYNYYVIPRSKDGEVKNTGKGGESRELQVALLDTISMVLEDQKVEFVGKQSLYGINYLNLGSCTFY